MLLALSGARELAGYAHSNMHALDPETAAMLGCTKGKRYFVARSVRPGPVDAAEHRSRFRMKRVHV